MARRCSWTCLLSIVVLRSVDATAAGELSIPLFFSKELRLNTLVEVEAALSRPLDTAWRVRLASGQSRQIKSCRDFLDVAKGHFELEREIDWSAWWQQGAHCFALDALRLARPAVRTQLGWFRFSKEGIAKLPPRFALLESQDDLDDVTAAEMVCRQWGGFDPSLRIRVESLDRAELRSDGWTGRLLLYARADIDGDGIEDLLVRRDGRVRGGTASESRVFVVTQTDPSRCPRVLRVMGTPNDLEGQ